MAVLILGVVVAPIFGTMRRQVNETRWTNERTMAMQLGNELLEYYRAIGYQGLRQQLATLGPATVPADGLPANNFLVYDSYVGFGSQNLFPLGVTAPPNAVHPCLGGPGDIGGNRFSTPADLAPPVTAGMPGSEIDQTLRQFFRFRRRVEIFGGDALAMPPPPLHFRPFPGITTPLDCYLIRVTIDTRNLGTMVKPTDQYQVVTVVARH